MPNKFQSFKGPYKFDLCPQTSFQSWRQGSFEHEKGVQFKDIQIIHHYDYQSWFSSVMLYVWQTNMFTIFNKLFNINSIILFIDCNSPFLLLSSDWSMTNIQLTFHLIVIIALCWSLIIVLLFITYLIVIYLQTSDMPSLCLGASLSKRILLVNSCI